MFAAAGARDMSGGDQVSVTSADPARFRTQLAPHWMRGGTG